MPNIIREAYEDGRLPFSATQMTVFGAVAVGGPAYYLNDLLSGASMHRQGEQAITELKQNVVIDGKNVQVAHSVTNTDAMNYWNSQALAASTETAVEQNLPTAPPIGEQVGGPVVAIVAGGVAMRWLILGRPQREPRSTDKPKVPEAVLPEPEVAPIAPALV